MVKQVIYMFAAAFLLSLLVVTLSGACDTACPLPHTSPWDRLVEKSFGLPRGLGAKLMEQQEWEEQKKLMAAMTPQERQLYKGSMRQTLLEKAKEMGIDLPGAVKARRPEKAGKDRSPVRPFVYAAREASVAAATE